MFSGGHIFHLKLFLTDCENSSVLSDQIIIREKIKRYFGYPSRNSLVRKYCGESPEYSQSVISLKMVEKSPENFTMSFNNVLSRYY